MPGDRVHIRVQRIRLGQVPAFANDSDEDGLEDVLGVVPGVQRRLEKSEQIPSVPVPDQLHCDRVVPCQSRPYRFVSRKFIQSVIPGIPINSQI